MPDPSSFDIIQKTLDDAGIDAEGNTTPEPTETPDDPEIVAPEGTEIPADSSGDDDPPAETTDPPVDAEAVAKAAAQATNQDEFDTLLDELGFRMPKPGQRENKVPLSRTRARMKTALKKYADKFGLERTDLTGKMTAAETELQTFRRVDAAIAAGATDPAAARRYIEMLAAVHPSYKAFLAEGGGAGAPVATVPQSLKDLGPKPGPDLKYDDGTVGFSPEQLDKRDEWLAASAEIRGYERSKKDYETRFGPIESSYRSATLRAQEAPKIEARISAVRDQWGELFLAQEKQETTAKGSSEIAKYQTAHPELSFEQVVTAVLLPKLRADRTTMRADLIAELNGKKKAASPSSGQATKAAPSGAPKTSREIVEAELERAGL
jgi:hypothetical protein